MNRNPLINKNTPTQNKKSVDLNIDNYNVEDLEKLFGFTDANNRPYKRQDIEQNQYAIVQRLIADKSIDEKLRRNIIQFYGLAKDKLINARIVPVLPPTTFQLSGREQLDMTDNKWTPEENGAYSGGNEYGRPGSTLDVFDVKSGRRDVNEVVRHFDKEFVNVNTSDIYAGVMNPLNTRFINKYLTVDSRFRDTPYTNSTSLINSSSDFTIQLNDKINSVISMQLASIELPITFYANSSYIGNTFMKISIFDISGNATSGIITIPDGSYTPTTIGSAISSVLAGAGGLFSTIGLSYSNTNGHFTISTSSNLVASFKLDFTTTNAGNDISFTECIYDDNDITICNSNPKMQTTVYTSKTPVNVDLTRRLGYSLGFLSGSYSGAKSYIGEAVANTNGSRYIFLAVDDFNTNVINNQFMTIAPQNITSKNILARLTVGNGGFLSILSENDFKVITEPRKFFGPVNISRLRIQLYDDYGLLINMNGGDFSLNLMLECVYDL